MAYATVADISALSKVSFGANTSISTAQVEGLISEEAAYIDGYLERRFTVPIAGDRALLIIKKICVQLVLKRLDPALNLSLIHI